MDPYSWSLHAEAVVLVPLLALGYAFVLRRFPAPGWRKGCFLAAFALASPLGLLLALIPNAVYDFYEHAPRVWGWSSLTDQQVAGLTMAAEEAVVFFAAFAFYFVRFMRGEETALDLRHARWTR